MVAKRPVATAIRFAPDLHGRLLTESTARDVSVNWLVNRLCAEALDRLVPIESFRLTGPLS